jgi:hypothetical protein
MALQPMTGFDFGSLGWAAGLFEGEGCIHSHPSRARGGGRCAKLDLAMTDEDVVRRFHSVVGVGVVYGPRFQGDRKPTWRWSTTRFEHAQYVVALFWNWFGRRRKAKAVSMLTEVHSDRFFLCRNRLHSMRDVSNHRLSHRGHTQCLACYRATNQRHNLKRATA